MAETIAWEDFERVEVRVGTVVDAQPFPEARKPSLKLWVDFGAPIGTRQTSAQPPCTTTPPGTAAGSAKPFPRASSHRTCSSPGGPARNISKGGSLFIALR